MAELYGKRTNRLDLARRTGSLAQFAGVQLYTLADGAERGVRCLEFRTGSGLIFRVMVDRAFDIGTVEFRGAAIGWQSPTGFRHPGLHETEAEDGLGWLRSFSGFLATCGLDHALGADTEPAGHYHYERKKIIRQPLHGRIANTPGRLIGYGEDWRGDECTFWCEGEVKQASVFGEDLHLIRRIEAKLGESEFTIRDRVVNHGFYRTPHMFLYHVNLGYPVLDKGSRYVAPIRHVIWASHAQNLRGQGVGYRTLPEPKHNFVEQVYEHAMAADAQGRVPVALVNPGYDGGRGIGLMIEVNKAEFPCALEWQHMQEGAYTIGLEPGTHHALGKSFALERDEMIWLEHGEERRYSTRFKILDGAAEIAATEAHISAICKQPEDEYPEISGRWND